MMKFIQPIGHCREKIKEIEKFFLSYKARPNNPIFSSV